MGKFPNVFDTLEQLASFLSSLTIVEINEFIRSVSYIKPISNNDDEEKEVFGYTDEEIEEIQAQWPSLFELGKHSTNRILDFVIVTNTNEGGIQVFDESTNLKCWLDYLDFARAITETYPLNLDYDAKYNTYPDIGFSSTMFAEFKLNWGVVFNPDIGRPIMPDRQLEFFLDDIRVSIGDCSPMWNFLIALPYWFVEVLDNEDRSIEIFSHQTIKFIGDLNIEIEALIAQSLYYINSNINPGDEMAFLVSVNSNNLRNGNVRTPDIHKKVHSLRRESKPFRLFNSADDFMGYYRVLEYFFLRARYEEIEHIRWEKELNNDDFIKAVENIYRKEEKKSLEMLMRQVANQEILETAVKYDLISKANAETLASSIYQRRNSFVHAKEERDAFIPSVFPYHDNLEMIWENLLWRLAIISIEKYTQ